MVWESGVDRVARDLSGVSAIGVDEVSYSKGHQYMTLIYQIDKAGKRLLGVVKKRKIESLSSFFEQMGEDWCSKIGSLTK